ncbi:MAG: sulfatase-like hydrolase/transferase [Planctomycetota bacterium]|nr:sulfatase-like hydrolase/transferase [Planctomycetota bacterium]
MSRRRIFLLLAFLTVASRLAIAPRGNAAEKPNRPNILFIYTDDHSHRTVSCYPEAYDWVNTPNIDDLAKRGVRFTHAYIGTWCMPSRAALLTGHHSYGVESMRMVGEYPGSEYDPAKCPFWPSVFRNNGYCTAQIGKWHTGTDTGFGRDWDYQVVWNRPRHVKNSGAYYYDQLIETNGGEAKLTAGYSTDNYTKWADDFIRGEHRDADKPWYLWVCYGAVHGPFTPADRHMNAYPDIRVPTPADIFPPRPGKPQWEQKIEFWVKGDNGEPVMKGGAFGGKTVEGAKGIHGNTLTDWVRQYHQGVLAIDEGVGKLMATLKDTGQLDNTLVVFTSDQGFGWGQHGFCTKLAPYDATIRSPMIVSMPSKLPQDAVCESPVGGVDMVPTFFNFAGIELPWTMHGHDLTPLLKNPKLVRKEPVLTTLTGRMYGSDTDVVPTDPEILELSGVPWWVSLMSGRLKYIRALKEGQIEELYDLANDPEELTNLAINSDFAGKLSEMRAATIAELKRTDAGMADGLPPVKKAF